MTGVKQWSSEMSSFCSAKVRVGARAVPGAVARPPRPETDLETQFAPYLSPGRSGERTGENG